MAQFMNCGPFLHTLNRHWGSCGCDVKKVIKSDKNGNS